MRKSPEVPVTLLAAMALTMIGCRDEPRHCVDAENRLQPDATCQVHSGSGYRYVYDGRSGWHTGDLVVGSSEGGISRGGFGHGGGEGGGE